MALYQGSLQQVQAIREQAARARTRRRDVAQAYLALVQSEWGQVILDDLVQSVLLRPNTCPEDEGERRVVLKMLRLIAEAPAVLADESA